MIDRYAWNWRKANSSGLAEGRQHLVVHWPNNAIVKNI